MLSCVYFSHKVPVKCKMLQLFVILKCSRILLQLKFLCLAWAVVLPRVGKVCSCRPTLIAGLFLREKSTLYNISFLFKTILSFFLLQKHGAVNTASARVVASIQLGGIKQELVTLHGLGTNSQRGFTKWNEANSANLISVLHLLFAFL